ncbi:hypothetical protein [Aneurinibacillus aneurinilyticus]|uniref:hypothetical protein n=1 Tax=Aneurinibacillus aneurinilyticus TaxID=1391 RepID=UPI0035262A83
MSDIFYKGVRYQSVVDRNVSNGGKIVNIVFKSSREKKTVEITTDYANGMTISTERLTYGQDVLLSWGIRYNDEKDFTLIFSRNQYETIKKKIAAKNKKQANAIA